MQTDTSYLGFRLPHPFIAGASPFGYHVDTVKRLEDAGCAGVVLHSLFEEQITLAHEGRVRHIDPFDREFADTLADFPGAADYPLSPDAYAEHVSRVKQAVSIPVIGSLNGTTGRVVVEVRAHHRAGWRRRDRAESLRRRHGSPRARCGG